MENQHWAVPLIGKPWEAGQQGPDAFDCWGLLAWVYKQQYSILLPRISVAEGDLRSQIKAFRAHPEHRHWQQVDTPKEGDALLLRQSRHPIHVGIWIVTEGEAGVLHALQGAGVVFQTLNSLKLSGWSIEGVYRCQRQQ
jgi:cell wall-associated NlpC family hydrolase